MKIPSKIITRLELEKKYLTIDFITIHQFSVLNLTVILSLIKRITTIIIALALFSYCGKNTKKNNSNEKKLSINTKKKQNNEKSIISIN